MATSKSREEQVVASGAARKVGAAADGRVDIVVCRSTNCDQSLVKFDESKLEDHKQDDHAGVSCVWEGSGAQLGGREGGSRGCASAHNCCAI